MAARRRAEPVTVPTRGRRPTSATALLGELRRRRHGRRRRRRRHVDVELVVTNRAAFRAFVLGFLEHAEVLAPPEVRADIVAWLERLAAPAAGVSPRPVAGAEIQRILALGAVDRRAPGRDQGRDRAAVRHHDRPARRRPRARADDRRPAVLARRLPRRRRGRRRRRDDPARRPLPAPAAAHAGRGPRAARRRAGRCSPSPAPIPKGRSRPRSPSSKRALDLPDLVVDVGEPAHLDAVRDAVAAPRAAGDRLLVGRAATSSRPAASIPRSCSSRLGEWYLGAYCHRADDERMFRVDRIRGDPTDRRDVRARRHAASRPARSSGRARTTRGSRCCSRPRPRGSPRRIRPSRSLNARTGRSRSSLRSASPRGSSACSCGSGRRRRCSRRPRSATPRREPHSEFCACMPPKDGQGRPRAADLTPRRGDAHERMTGWIRR